MKMIGMALLSLLFISCSPVQFQTIERSNGKITIDPIVPTHPDESCYLETFNQPTANIKKLDILFVTDTSGSLDVERAAVANGIDSFVAGLSNDVDYNVAVMLGHGSLSAHSGRLYKSGTEPHVLTKAMGLTAVRSGLKTKLTSVQDDPGSDGGEEGLYSLNKGVTNASLYSQSQSYGFFRSDAALAIVFVSDENDICAAYPAGVTPVVDGDGKEVPAKARDCSGVTAGSVYTNLKAKMGMRPLLVSSVIYIQGQPVPAGGENEIGYGYLDITQLSKGLLVYLGGSTTQIAGGLLDIGKLANSQLDLIRKHTITQPGTVASMAVKVDGKNALFSYDVTTREVNLSEPGGSGSKVEIGYCVK